MPVTDPPAAKKARERVDVARDAAKERHLIVTGEVVWEWNALHRTFGYVFIALVGDSQPHVANALWLTPGSDKAQRDLLKTAVEWADGLREVDRERLSWALDQTDRLGAHRNDIVHGYPGFLITENGMTTHLSSGQNAFRRVLKQQRIDTPFHELMAALCDDLRRMERYVGELWRRCLKPIDGTRNVAPRRPVLRSLALVDAGYKRTHIPPTRKRRKPRNARRKVDQKPA
jgi:hypothetical protein